MIELSHVTIHSGEFRLTDINLRVDTGDYAVLMGKTGCGKTTLLEAICGLRSIDSGTIYLHGRNVTKLSPAKRLVGYVPQNLGLFTTKTVHEHLTFAPKLHGRSPNWINAKTAHLASLLGIEHLLKRSVINLSGGEAQRVALGRALSFEPPCLLLDEPLSALDESTRDDAYQLLKRVREETSVTTLHVTHSSQEAKLLATRLFEISNGCLALK